LAACSPLSTYYKAGVDVSRLNTDTLACQTDSLAKAPVANEIRQSPPIFVRGRQYCDAKGCYTGPGYWIEGDIYTVDTNKPLRDKLENQCMANKGYQPVSIKPCTFAVKQNAPKGSTTVLPKLTANSCVIKNDDGTVQIVQTAG
jgi:hypothetical protein